MRNVRRYARRTQAVGADRLRTAKLHTEDLPELYKVPGSLQIERRLALQIALLVSPDQQSLSSSDT